MLFIKISKHYAFENKVNLTLLNVTPRTNEDIDASIFYSSLIDTPYSGSLSDLNKQYEHSSDYDHFLLWGFHPEKLAWDSMCQSLWNETLLPHCNIRRTAHAALGYYLAKDLLEKPFREKLENDFPYIVKNLLNFIPVERPETDTGLEGILALILLGKSNEIHSKWIAEIMNNQLPDGGWAWDGSKEKKSHPHTTVLALWVLSEVKSKTIGFNKK